jgi:hypothetical protein
MRIDLHARAAAEGVDLASALRALRTQYDDIDARNAKNTASLDLPCHRGCSMCCEDSVLLTWLEFYAVWDHLQRTCDDATLARIIADGLALYEKHRALIESLTRREETAGARLIEVKYRCPILDDAGACRAYEWRETSARLFGASFNDDGGVYGCHLVGAHLADKLVTLVRARPAAERVHSLPLGGRQQIYPFYIHALYGS